MATTNLEEEEEDPSSDPSSSSSAPSSSATPNLERSLSSGAFSRLKSSASKLKAQTTKSLRQAASRGAEFAKKMQESEPGKAAAKRLVEAVMGDWVEGVSADWTQSDDDGDLELASGDAKLKASWRKGEFALYGVRLKPKTLEGLGFGSVKVVFGEIGEAKLVVPWTRLGSAPVTLTLRDVVLDAASVVKEFNVVQEAPGNVELLEVLDALRNQLRAKLLGSAKRRGSVFRRGARKVALRALSKVDLELRNVTLSYQGMALSLDRFKTTTDGSHSESFFTAASVKAIRLGLLLGDERNERVVPTTPPSEEEEEEETKDAADDASAAPTKTTTPTKQQWTPLFSLEAASFGLEDTNLARVSDVTKLRAPDPSRLLRELASRGEEARSAALRRQGSRGGSGCRSR